MDQRTDSLGKIKISFRNKIFILCLFIFLIFILLALFTYKKNRNYFSSRSGIFPNFSLNDLPFVWEKRYINFPEADVQSESEIPTDPNKNSLERFKTENIFEETSSMGKSNNPNWWLNSGGIMNVGKNQLGTNLGALPKNSNWRKIYAESNSKDTDNGYYPQNIFRLVSRSKWKNFRQSMYFYIDSINLSGSENRNESNGVLFFNRYQDGDNLYYAGLRVDGDAVIKKKIDDKYTTLSEKNVFSRKADYDRNSNPNFIPLKTWIGIKSEVINEGSNVRIKLFVDLDQSGNWEQILEAIDRKSKKKEPLTESGYAGIRTDFMDAYFKEYHVEEIR